MARLVEAVATGRHPDATPDMGNCSAIAGTWGNGPVHHLPGKRRAVRPAVAGLRLFCATHDARVGDFGIADDAGFVDVFREARRNVIGCRLQSILAGTTFRPTLCDLTTFLRRVVFVGEAA
jgi:hypothetical protein